MSIPSALTRRSATITERLPQLDGLSPLDMAARFRDLGSVALLEDRHRTSGTGWTFVSAGPLTREELADPGPDPFAGARALLARMAPGRVRGAEAPPWTGGLAGYLSYDLGRCFERLPSLATDDRPFPLLHLGLYDWVLAWDWRRARAWLCCRRRRWGLGPDAGASQVGSGPP